MRIQRIRNTKKDRNESEGDRETEEQPTIGQTIRSLPINQSRRPKMAVMFCELRIRTIFYSRSRTQTKRSNGSRDQNPEVIGDAMKTSVSVFCCTDVIRTTMLSRMILPFPRRNLVNNNNNNDDNAPSHLSVCTVLVHKTYRTPRCHEADDHHGFLLFQDDPLKILKRLDFNDGVFRCLFRQRSSIGCLARYFVLIFVGSFDCCCSRRSATVMLLNDKVPHTLSGRFILVVQCCGRRYANLSRRGGMSDRKGLC